MANLLSRDAILSASDIKSQDVKVPEWGGIVRVKGLTAAQRDKVEATMLSMKTSAKAQDVNVGFNMSGVRALIASMGIVDENDNRLFTEKDVKALGEKSGAALDRVYTAITDLSEFSDEDIEELSKNSEADQSEGSPSA